MKIVFLIQDISTPGGTERTTCCLAAQLHRQGHDVSVVSVFKNETRPHYHAEGVAWIYLTEQPYTARQTALQRFCRLTGTIRKARRCAALREADCIICQKIAASALAYMAGFRHKSIAAEHFKYGMYTPFMRKLRHRMYSRMRAVVTLTEKDRQLYAQDGLKEVYHIPNMVSVVPRPYHGEDSRRILSVGRLTCQKGYDLLLKAVEGIAGEMEDYYIDIYGDGEDREKLEKQCKEMQLTDKVHFCGHTDSIESIYADSAFYVMSSRFEGFPMVLLEAAACGLPVVSFDCPEGPSVLLRNGGGILVEKENTRALGQAIRKMIQHPEWRAQYRKQLQQTIAPYSPQAIGEQWENLLVRIITKSNER